MAQFGAVAAGHKVTALAAEQVLSEGGNAFDALVAALWVACVAEPVLASPGGGGFLMAWQDGKASLLDFFAHTPKVKKPQDSLEFEEIIADFGTATQAFHIGAGASAMPGYIPGLFAINRQYGRMPMRDLVAPAVAAARDGVEISPFQAYLSGVVTPILTWTEEARALYAGDGNVPKAGDRFKNPALADALDMLGHEGERLGTEGEIAAAMLAESRDHGGYLTKDDFAAYQCITRQPISRSIGKWTAYINPAPSIGGTLIAAMLASLPEGQPSMRDLADAVAAVDRQWRKAPNDLAALEAFGLVGAGGLQQRGTTHVSVIDRAGNAASATVTNGEGNGRLVRNCGFMMNNMLGESDLNPTGFHQFRPDQRLASMMAPTLLGNDKGHMTALGSGGSNRIRTAIFQVLVRHVLEGLPLDEAIAAPRFHFEREHLDFEDCYGEEQRALLCEGFADRRAWPEPNMFFGGVHAVGLHGTSFSGLGDPRREGAFLQI